MNNGFAGSAKEIIYLCGVAPPDFLQRDVILLLLLCTHVGDLSMRRLVPEIG